MIYNSSINSLESSRAIHQWPITRENHHLSTGHRKQNLHQSTRTLWPTPTRNNTTANGVVNPFGTFSKGDSKSLDARDGIDQKKSRTVWGKSSSLAVLERSCDIFYNRWEEFWFPLRSLRSNGLSDRRSGRVVTIWKIKQNYRSGLVKIYPILFVAGIRSRTENKSGIASRARKASEIVRSIFLCKKMPLRTLHILFTVFVWRSVLIFFIFRSRVIDLMYRYAMWILFAIFFWFRCEMKIRKIHLLDFFHTNTKHNKNACI